MNTEEETRIFLEQYKAISDQIIHWDTFFWSKSQFFLAVESVALLGIGKLFVDKGDCLNFTVITQIVIVTGTFLNIFLCFVWLRTGIRNRQFLNMRFEVGMAMEKHAKFNPEYMFALYTYQQWTVEKKLPKKPSHESEIGIPFAFGLVWVFIFVAFTVNSLRAVDLSSLSYITSGIYLVWIALGICLSYLLVNEYWGDVYKKKIPETANKYWTEFQKDKNEWGI